MRNVAVTYRIYKDRFLLAFALSLLVHLIAYFLYRELPMPKKDVVLRPISLGVLQSQKAQESMESKMAKQSKTEEKPQLKQEQIQATVRSSPNKTTTKAQIKSAPSTNIDLQSLSIPQSQGKFNPFAAPKPSLIQNLKAQADNASFDKLPKAIQDDLMKLYGTELQNMSKEQKDYLAESYFLNGEVFQQTADRMGYPQLATYLKQQGVGLIEFVLYPDGHIENIKIVQSTNSEVLDDSMRQLIEQAAKNLKRPPKPIQIRVRGNYSLQSR